MKKEECFELGHITKTVGLKGEVYLYIKTDNPKAYQGLEAVLLEMGKNLVPFMAEKFQVNGKQAMVKFEGLNSPAEAQMLVNKTAYLPKIKQPKLKGKDFYADEVIGFMLSDTKLGDLGPVELVMELPNQRIFQATYQNCEIMIPAVPDFITKIDRKNKRIELNTPEGLLDIYIQQKNKEANNVSDLNDPEYDGEGHEEEEE